ncbi:MAG: histidine phosphatase family protein [Nocardioides sp.]
MGQIVLVRHGQASFGSEDYDQLSALGVSQAERLGSVGVAGDAVAVVLQHGTMRRQADTAARMADTAGWRLTPRVDDRWNEYDHLSLAGAGTSGPPTEPRAFQSVLEEHLRGWVTGTIQGIESYRQFADRVLAVFTEAVTANERLTVVSTSGGVISWLANHVLGGSPEQWILLNRVCVNTGATRFLVGRHGVSLLTFNDHAHLPRTMITYR